MNPGELIDLARSMGFKMAAGHITVLAVKPEYYDLWHMEPGGDVYSHWVGVEEILTLAEETETPVAEILRTVYEPESGFKVPGK